MNQRKSDVNQTNQITVCMFLLQVVIGWSTCLYMLYRALASKRQDEALALSRF